MPDELFELMKKRAAKSLYPNPNDPQGSMQLALLHMQDSMPREASGVTGLSPSKVPLGIMLAYTNPTRSIIYDPNQVFARQEDNDATMAHELTHVGQFMNMGINPLSWLKTVLDHTKPYYQQDQEKEAFAAPYKYMLRRDIQLPRETK